MNLKEKTISGLTWSFIDNFAKQGITFLVGIVLARLLSPREFGLIGMITIFIAISQSIIDSGFSQALIRKKDCSQIDYSTVFYFNLTTGFVMYLLLFFSAESISLFFHETQLKLILQVLGIGLIINALSIIQATQLTKNINFKLQTKISLVASISSGIIGIAMAYNGYGVWSLVAKILSGYAITSLFLWLWNKWKPSLIFSYYSFRGMFAFGSKILFSGLIYTTYLNIYLLVIGKYFSATDLGYYTRADQFKNIPSQNISSIIQRVSYPVLSTIQDDIPKLKSAFQKLIKSTMLITFILTLGLAAVAKPMILTLIGEKWLPSVIYLQMLCFVGMLYPLHSLNLNLLNVLGRSDLFLRLEIIKILFAIPVIIIGILYGIKTLIIASLAFSILGFFMNSYWAGKFIGYSGLKQLWDILPSFILGISMSGIVFSFGTLLSFCPLTQLVLQLLLGLILSIGLCEIFKLKEYFYIKEIVLTKSGIKKGNSK